MNAGVFTSLLRESLTNGKGGEKEIRRTKKGGKRARRCGMQNKITKERKRKLNSRFRIPTARSR